jgi:hypothetical protein
LLILHAEFVPRDHVHNMASNERYICHMQNQQFVILKIRQDSVTWVTIPIPFEVGSKIDDICGDNNSDGAAKDDDVRRNEGGEKMKD